LLLPIVLILAGSVPAARVFPAAPDVLDEATPAELLAMNSRPQAIRRDAILGFHQGSAKDARTDLQASDLASPRERAVALVALGSAGAVEDRPGLELAASFGQDPIVRQAALLAMGEMGEASTGFLLDVVAKGEPLEVDPALHALLRCGSDYGRREVERLADSGAGPVSTSASALLASAAHPLAQATATDDLWRALRWEAARRYGLVGGKSWRVRLLEALADDEWFVDFVILREAAEIDHPSVRDHILQILLARGGPAAVGAAAIAMPAQLDAMLLAGLWRPASDVEWSLMLAEIEDAGTEHLVPGILASATEVPMVEDRALALLMATGHPQAERLALERLNDPRPAKRAAVALALGGSNRPKWIAELGRMRGDPNPEVWSAALVAQACLDHVEARDTIADLVLDPESEERPHVISALRAAAANPRVRPLIQKAATTARNEELRALAPKLVNQGRVLQRGILRESLESGEAGQDAWAMVRALGQGADARDLELLHEIFPSETDRFLNVEAARVLVRWGDPLGVEFLQEVLWSGPWHRSALAGALFVRVRGVAGIVEELASPPAGSGRPALRRVGFVLGEWGGIDQVQLLASERSSGDPALQGAYLGALSMRTH
jgi:hypothetical protein